VETGDQINLGKATRPIMTTQGSDRKTKQMVEPWVYNNKPKSDEIRMRIGSIFQQQLLTIK